MHYGFESGHHHLQHPIDAGYAYPIVRSMLPINKPNSISCGIFSDINDRRITNRHSVGGL